MLFIRDFRKNGLHAVQQCNLYTFIRYLGIYIGIPGTLWVLAEAQKIKKKTLRKFFILFKKKKNLIFQEMELLQYLI